MVEEIDIYRAANLLIKQHGEEAALFAAMQADEFLKKGDLDGKVMWLAVISAIEELSPTFGHSSCRIHWESCDPCLSR